MINLFDAGIGAVVGSVVTVLSKAVYNFVSKQTASVKADVAAEVTKVEGEIKSKV
jgi:hypothetical protein